MGLHFFLDFNYFSYHFEFCLPSNVWVRRVVLNIKELQFAIDEENVRCDFPIEVMMVSSMRKPP